MKKVIFLAALAALSACSKTAPPPAPDAPAEATPAAVAGPVAADGKSSVGTFKITNSDGTVIMEEDRADGTYTDTQDGKVIETGKWVQKSPNSFCFTKDGEGAKEVCTVETVDDKGVWTSTNPETKKTATIERVEG